MKRSQLGNIVDLLGVATVEEPTASKCEHGAQVNKATARSVLGCGCGKLNKQVVALLSANIPTKTLLEMQNEQICP